jgi:hypothetical protein
MLKNYLGSQDINLVSKFIPIFLRRKANLFFWPVFQFLYNLLWCRRRYLGVVGFFKKSAKMSNRTGITFGLSG